MGGTTAVWAMPYPTGTDRVADGDNAIQALAERIAAVNTSEFGVPRSLAYNAFTPTNGWAGTWWWIVRAGWVHIVWNGTKTAHAAEVMAVIPSGVRPGKDFQVAAMGVTTSAHAPVAIGTDGAMFCLLPSTGTGGGGVVGNAAYPLP